MGLLGSDSLPGADEAVEQIEVMPRPSLCTPNPPRIPHGFVGSFHPSFRFARRNGGQE